MRVERLAQNVTFKSNDQTLVEAFRGVLTISQQKARSALAKFLFTKDGARQYKIKETTEIIEK